MTKGRGLIGEKVGTARLTSIQAAEIKGADMKRESQKSLAQRFGVTVYAINAIRAGRNWKHVEPITTRDYRDER